MQAYLLPYNRVTAAVMDTEVTMVAASRLIVENSACATENTKWHGCVDHLLELVTGLDFTGTPETLGTMSACCSLAIFLTTLHRPLQKAACKAAGWKTCEAYPRYCNQVVVHLFNGR
jgi:hypothetical protein